jgi:hypothetical protein
MNGCKGKLELLRRSAMAGALNVVVDIIRIAAAG